MELENLEDSSILESAGYANLALYKATQPTEVEVEVDSSSLGTIKSNETGPAPEDEAAKHCVGKKASALTAEEYSKARAIENEEFLASGLHAVESLAPFSLKRVYGRLDNVPVLNFTGIFTGIVYASSNIVILYDYIDNTQKCLQGHRNTITCLQMETKGRFIVSADAGKRSLIIVWEWTNNEIKPLKYFPNSHDGNGCLFACFTGMDFIFASISSVGTDEVGKQTISFWDYEPKDPEKIPIFTETFPKTTSVIRELTFLDGKPEFFAATGDRNVIFGTWRRDRKSESVFLHKARLRTSFILKYKRFSSSIWMKKGEWLATATGAGYVVIWGPPVILALEDPPDPIKNIKEYQRSFKLCEDGITVFQIYKEYVVVGDEVGIVRFFDHEFKLLRWCRNFNLPAIYSISFNRSEDVPEFKKQFRQKFNTGDINYPTTNKNSRAKDYTRGGSKFKQASKTTLPRPPMPCPDFVIGVAGGDVYYYHFNEEQQDRLVRGSPGSFIACDACPGSNHVAFTTAKGDVQVYHYITHQLIFSDRVFAANSRITTMKFHPFGQICAFGLYDGRISFRWNYTWKTSMPPMVLTPDPIVRIVFSVDGLHMAYNDKNQTVVVMKYLPKGHGWMVLGKSKAHFMSIVDLQFFVEPEGTCNRLFTMSLDRHLIEYDIDRSAEDTGLYIVKITCLEQTATPTAMVFEGPHELGIDCITLANSINKIRLFSLEDEKIRKTVSAPVFGRDKGIKRMIAFPIQLTEERFKTFIVYIVKNKLGLMDTPLDGNPHKYMAVYTHPRDIVDVAVLPDRERIFTIGKDDNAAFVFSASPKAVEATVLMGGSGITPFYHTIKRHWGGACQDVIKDLDMIFFFLNVKRIDKQTELYRMNRNIRLCEISAVCRACGFFPSEYEVGLMMDEARRIKLASQTYTDDFATEFSFDEFVKLFVNHFYRTTDEDVDEAFKTLGFEGEQDQPYICKHDFVKYLTTEGEKISSNNFPIFFDAMYDVRVPGEFGDVKCHTVLTEVQSSGSSSTSSITGAIKKDEEEESEFESFSSGSSSTLSDDDGDELDDEEEDEQEQDELEAENVEEEDVGDKDDDQQDARKSLMQEQRNSNVEPFEEEQEDNSGEGVQMIEELGEFDNEEMKDFDVPEDDEELVDLPERVDLMYFLEKMLPSECQQTIRWQPNVDMDKEETDLSKKPDAKLAKEEKIFLNSILKQMVDPNFPVPRKLLNSLYAEFYLQHGNFSVPPDIRFPGIILPGDNWYNESEQTEGTSKTSHSSSNNAAAVAAEHDEEQVNVIDLEQEGHDEDEEDEVVDQDKDEEEEDEDEDEEGEDEEEEDDDEEEDEVDQDKDEEWKDEDEEEEEVDQDKDKEWDDKDEEEEEVDQDKDVEWKDEAEEEVDQDKHDEDEAEEGVDKDKNEEWKDEDQEEEEDDDEEEELELND